MKSSNSLTTLKELVKTISSGGRPRGGATSNGVFSIGAEHLDGFGGFSLQKGKYIPLEYYKYIGKGKIERDDILIVKDGATTGKVSYVGEDFLLKDAAINEHVFRLQLDQTKIFPKFCFHYLFSDVGYKAIMSDFRGATVGGISKGFIDKIKIPLPPLPTQKRIAEILDKADNLRKKNKQLLQCYDDLAQSLFIDMFGDPAKNEKGWKPTALKKLFTSNPRLGTITPVSNEGVVKVVRVGELGDIDVDIEKCKKVTLSENDKERFLVKIDDILLARAIGSIDHLGKASLIRNITGELAFDSHVMRLQFDQRELLSHFFYVWLKSDGGRKIFLKSAGKTSVQFNINGEQISKIEINLPPIHLQNQFIRQIQNIEQQKEKLKAQMQQSENLSQALLQRAFNGGLN